MMQALKLLQLVKRHSSGLNNEEIKPVALAIIELPLSEGISEWVSEWDGERASEWVSEWGSQPVIQLVSQSINQLVENSVK